MKVLEKIHKIDDLYIILWVAVWLAIILIYWITTLSSLKLEVQSLHDKLHEIQLTNKETITQSIHEWLSETIRTTMREEFTYDRQNYKFIIED